MFDQQRYINGYIKDNYKSIKLRIRKDDEEIISYLSTIENVNAYIISLIRKDMETFQYHYINNDIRIDFPLSKAMEDLIKKAEAVDIRDDYGLYMNLVDAIDSQAKKEVGYHILTPGQWRTLLRRYVL